VSIDVINDLEFPEGEQLLKHARSMAQRLVDLKHRAKAACIPVVYVNHNFGRWQSNFTVQVKHCLQDGVRGKEIAELIAKVLKADIQSSTDLDLEAVVRKFHDTS
jgi:nicotinamidase-related amidase